MSPSLIRSHRLFSFLGFWIRNWHEPCVSEVGANSLTLRSNRKSSAMSSEIGMTPEIRDRMIRRLGLLYGEDKALSLANRIEQLIASRMGQFPNLPGGWTERDVFLITYADSLLPDGGEASPLGGLRDFLQKHVGERITFLHLLPFYPFSSDDGFSVIDYREVRHDLGNWADIGQLAADYRLVFDGVINHVSQRSLYVQGYLDGNPHYADFCLAIDPETDTSMVTRPRTLPLLHDFEAHDGPRWLWTTFSRDQVDLNFANPEVLLEVIDVLLFYLEKGASMIRLDAIPYLWKKLGTNCVHLPETHEIIKLCRDVYDAVAPGMILLSETNVPHRENISYWGDKGDEAQQIYNFSLAPLVLFSMETGTASRLTEWAGTLEPLDEKCVLLNITATHDGIGMRPTEGILTEEERRQLIDLATRHGGRVSYKTNPDGTETPYELNLCYFDAINNPNDELLAEDVQVARFLCAQAIPMVLMGMPGIYIHSLLGSRNDYAGREKTGMARSINRESLVLTDLDAELETDTSLRSRVFSGILNLLEIRQAQPAFHPNAHQAVVSVGRSVFGVLRASRDTDGQRILALFNVSAEPQQVPVGAVISGAATDLVSGVEYEGELLRLEPYQVAWLTW